MKKYTIDFTVKKEGNYSLIPIVEKVETNDGIGDIICIDGVIDFETLKNINLANCRL